jgi:hypothetical protein
MGGGDGRMVKRLLFAIAMLFFLHGSSFGARDVYDPYGNPLGPGEGTLLLQLQQTDQPGAGLTMDFSRQSLLAFRNYITLTAFKENISNEVTFGFFPSKFTNLTLYKPNFFDANAMFGLKWTVHLVGNKFTSLVYRVSSDRYLVGLRDEAQFGPLSFGFSLVSQKTGMNLLGGTSQPPSPEYLVPPERVYLRFRDASPEDGEGGAALYGVKVYVNGEEVDISPGIIKRGDVEKGDHWETNGKDELILSYDISAYQDAINSLAFDVDIANDYQVEISSDPSFPPSKTRLVLSAMGNVKDMSNRGIRRFWYGIGDSDTILGIDLETVLWGTWIRAEYASLLSSLRFPSRYGEHFNSSDSAFYIKAMRRFGPLSLRGEGFKIGPFYDASFAVDPSYEFIREGPTIEDVDPDDLIPEGLDRDGDYIPDYKQDFLMFDSDPPGFKLGVLMDLNNNGMPDIYEKGLKPNYPYDRGALGFHLWSDLDLKGGLVFTAGYKDERRPISDQRDRTVYGVLRHIFQIPSFNLRARYLFKRSWDTIPDDYRDPGSGNIVLDKLEMRDYLTNIFTFIALYNGIKNLKMMSKLKYQYDVNFAEGRNMVDTMAITRAAYDIELGKLTITPMYKNYLRRSYTVPREEEREVSEVGNLGILRFNYKLTQDITLGMGGQYYLYMDQEQPLNNYSRAVVYVSITNRTAYMGRNIAIVAGYNYGITNYWTVGKKEMGSILSIRVMLL